MLQLMSPDVSQRAHAYTFTNQVLTNCLYVHNLSCLVVVFYFSFVTQVMWR